MATRVTLQEIANMLTNSAQTESLADGFTPKLTKIHSFKSEVQDEDELLVSRKRMWKRQPIQLILQISPCFLE